MYEEAFIRLANPQGPTCQVSIGRKSLMNSRIVPQLHWDPYRHHTLS